VSFHPAGRFILSGSKDQTLRLWDLKSDLCWIMEGHKDYIYCSEFLPMGSHIISVAGDGTVREWPMPLEATAQLGD
jgi:WD40 repeat protein